MSPEDVASELLVEVLGFWDGACVGTVATLISLSQLINSGAVQGSSAIVQEIQDKRKGERVQISMLRGQKGNTATLTH